MDQNINPIATPTPAPQAAPAQQAAPAPVATKKSNTGSIVAIIVLLILLIGAGVFCTITYLDSKDKSAKIESLESTVASKNETIGEIAEAAGVSTDEVTKDTVKEVMQDTSGLYISLNDIGYKVKLPDTIEYVSYMYSASDGPSLTIWAALKDQGYQAFPAYAMPEHNEGGLGHFTFCDSSRKKFCKHEFNVEIAEFDDYTVYYEGPQSVMDDIEKLQKDEQQVVKILLDNFSNKDNYSKL